MAWHLGQRIRTMIQDRDIVLSGVGEMDEVYVEAAPFQKHGGGPTSIKTGRGPHRPLGLAMVERGGSTILSRIRSHSTEAVKSASSGYIKDYAVISAYSLAAHRKVADGDHHLTVRGSVKRLTPKI